MSNYFRLHGECYLVNGTSRAAVYDLMNGHLIWLEPAVTLFLNTCEAGYSVEEAREKAGLTAEYTENLLAQMQANNLGMLYDQPVYIDHWRDRKVWKHKQFYEDPPTLQMAFLQITDQCNFDCTFCNPQRNIRQSQCVGCGRYPLQREALTIAEWKPVLEDLHRLECPTLLIGGGNPLQPRYEKVCAALIRLTHTIGFPQIHLVTNGTKLSDDLLLVLAQNYVLVIVQVYSHLPEVHDAITQSIGSWHEVISNVKRLQEAKVSFAFTLLHTEKNQEHIGETLSFYQQFNPQHIFTDYLYPGSAGEMEDVPVALAEQLFIKRSNLTQVSLPEFMDRQQYSTCLHGKLSISADGYLSACPAMAEQRVGDIRKESLHALIANKSLNPYWEFSKDKVPYCQGCEFRYACLDCRALHVNTTGKEDGLAYCAYEPTVGQWRDVESIPLPVV